jgi:hypothetical protein
MGGPGSGNHGAGTVGTVSVTGCGPFGQRGPQVTDLGEVYSPLDRAGGPCLRTRSIWSPPFQTRRDLCFTEEVAHVAGNPYFTDQEDALAGPPYPLDHHSQCFQPVRHVEAYVVRR